MTAQTILPANTLSSGFDVANSLRFNDDSSDYLSQTYSSSGNQRTFTISFWFKRGNLANGNIYTYQDASNEIRSEFILYDDYMKIVFNPTGSEWSADMIVQENGTNVLFRDTSAWYHVVMAIDTTQGTEANRIKVYINGNQKAMSAYPSENFDTGYNTDIVHSVGSYIHAANTFFDGYFAEFCVIDGSQLAATSFGEFDEDSAIWKPKNPAGLTFGTNGFYLQFKESGTSANASGMGADTSGNDHHFTVHNLTADSQTTDTCTNNFATLNVNNGTGSRTSNDVYTEGNTIVVPSSHDNYTTTFATMGAKNGKWYWEAQSIVEGTASNAYYPRTIGIMTDNNPLTASTLGQDEFSWDVVYNSGNWDASHNNSVVVNDMSTNRTSGNILQFALDLDNGKFYFGIGGSYLNSGDPTTGSTGTGAIHTLSAADLSNFIIPAVTNATTGTYYKFNFGNPAFSISSGNADANGYGNFEYAVPSGYFAWCSKNLAENG